MPPRTRLRPPEIPGLVPRSGTYRVTTLAEIDSSLAALRVWLDQALDRVPEFSFDYLRRYHADVDALLDARGRVMGLG